MSLQTHWEWIFLTGSGTFLHVFLINAAQQPYTMTAAHTHPLLPYYNCGMHTEQTLRRISVRACLGIYLPGTLGYLRAPVGYGACLHFHMTVREERGTERDRVRMEGSGEEDREERCSGVSKIRRGEISGLPWKGT